MRHANYCYVCGQPRTALCDAVKLDGKPCDAPLCDKHKLRISYDTHVCPRHEGEEFAAGTLERREALLYYAEKCPYQMVPGHHPDHFCTKDEVDEHIKQQDELFDTVFSDEQRKFMANVERQRKSMEITLNAWADYLSLHPALYCDYRAARVSLPHDHRKTITAKTGQALLEDINRRRKTIPVSFSRYLDGVDVPPGVIPRWKLGEPILPMYWDSLRERIEMLED